MQTNVIQIKPRIFFISDINLSKFIKTKASKIMQNFHKNNLFFHIFLVAKSNDIGYYLSCFNGHMAELVDALVSGTSGSNTLEVRVFLCPPYV